MDTPGSVERPKSRVMFLRVTEDEYWQIAHLAATMRMPRAQLVRLMLGDVLRRHGGRGPTFQIPEITA